MLFRLSEYYVACLSLFFGVCHFSDPNLTASCLSQSLPNEGTLLSPVMERGCAECEFVFLSHTNRVLANFHIILIGMMRGPEFWKEDPLWA